MKTEKSYIVITKYAMRNNNISMCILDTIEEAMKEAQNELDVEYSTNVEIYESDKAQKCFFCRQIFKYTKKQRHENKK